MCGLRGDPLAACLGEQEAQQTEVGAGPGAVGLSLPSDTALLGTASGGWMC